MLDSCSTEIVSIENYEIQISKSVFMHIQMYLCRISFLTTLNINKDYFKSSQKGCKGCGNCSCTHIVIGDKIVIVHRRSCYVFASRVL